MSNGLSQIVKAGGGPKLFSFLSREIAAGLISGVSALTLCLVNGALIFSGPLHPFLGEGIAASLMTCAVLALVVAATSQFPIAIAAPVVTSSAVLANLMISLGPAVAGLSRGATLALAYAALFLATASTGAVLLLLGITRATKFVRFVPYPVVSGFMAATGWLVTAGAIKMATDVPLEARALGAFVHTREATSLALLVAWTALLWIATQRIKHPLTLPAALVLASIAADVALPLLGIDAAAGRSQGFYFSIANPHWPGIPALNGSYLVSDWSRVLHVAGGIGAVILIGVLQALLIATGLELSTRTEIDLDREMRSIGVANLASAALGGFVGQIALSTTGLNRAAGGKTRLTGIVVSLLALLSIFGGASALELIPRFVLGGALLLQGLRLLQEWVVGSYRTLPRLEWLLVVAVVVLTAWLGFIPAELAGLLAACVLFAISVSRTEPVSAVIGIDASSSSVIRPEEEIRFLSEHGHRAQVVALRGYVFFGSAYQLRQRVKTIIAERQPVILIFDFSKVVGIDTSAAATMVGISRMLQDKKIKQAIVGLAPASERIVRAAGGLDDTVLQFPDIDEALEEGEKLILSEMRESLFPKQTFAGWISHILGSNEDFEVLQRHLVRSQVAAGSFLCHQGETTDDLYFLEAGRLSAVIEPEGSHPIRIRVFGEKVIVGEIAFVLNVPRTASLRVDEDAVVWVLRRGQFDELLKTHPTLVLKLLQHMVRLQVERLSFATRRIAVLQIAPAGTSG